MNTDARGIDSPKGGGEDATAKPQEPGDAERHAPKEEAEHTEERPEGVPAEVLNLLQEMVDLCALGGIDENTDDGLGWAGLVRDAKALLATHPTPAQAAPQAETPAGWKLVPVELTPKMMMALGEWTVFTRRAYRDLLSAAPSAFPVELEQPEQPLGVSPQAGPRSPSQAPPIADAACHRPSYGDLPDDYEVN